MWYEQLPLMTGFEQASMLGAYQRLDADSWIAVTDVLGSTQAIREGRYRDVNAVGAASIIAAINAVPEHALGFVFGGDGATIIGPGAARGKVETALGHARLLARDAFNLELRAGIVDMASLLREDAWLAAARLHLASGVSLALLDGPGTDRAEALVKGKDGAPPCQVPDVESLNLDLFEGYECRWQPVLPQRGEVVCVLIKPLGNSEDRAATLAEVTQALTALGAFEPPVHESGLHLSYRPDTLRREGAVRSGRRRGWGALRETLTSALRVTLGAVMLATGSRGGSFDGATYLSSLIERTDYRRYDGMLRLALDLSETQHARLRERLSALHASGRLLFGTHVNRAALITCFVRDYAERHVHFLDGSDGGFTLASVELKQQAAPPAKPGHEKKQG